MFENLYKEEPLVDQKFFFSGYEKRQGYRSIEHGNPHRSSDRLYSFQSRQSFKSLKIKYLHIPGRNVFEKTLSY